MQYFVLFTPVIRNVINKIIGYTLLLRVTIPGQTRLVVNMHYRFLSQNHLNLRFKIKLVLPITIRSTQISI